MNMNDIILVKLGGNILEIKKNLANTISQLEELIEKNLIINKVVIIPGGGSKSNFIRFIDKKLEIGDDLAHWEAIYAMNWNGLQIHKTFPKIPFYSQISELKDDLNKKNNRYPLIFLPFDYLYENDILPHSWNITSDSITIFIAKNLGLHECFLIKNIDGIYDNNNQIIKEISAKKYLEFIKLNKLANIGDEKEDFKKSQPIDPYSLKLIDEYKIKCIILNGFYSKSRILEFFSEFSRKEKIYTEIHYSNSYNS